LGVPSYDSLVTSTLWTVGYGGTTIEHLIDDLRSAEIATVVDTRANPFSPRPAFRRAALERALTEGGLRYVTIPALGAPKDIRSLPTDGSFQAAYERHLASAMPELTDLIRRAESERICLLCAEADPAECHRSVLAKRVARSIQADIVHLRPGQRARTGRAVFLAPTATDAEIEAAVAALRE